MSAAAEDVMEPAVLRRDEPMRKHTSWRVGGPADWFAAPRDLAELRAVLASLPRDVPVYWVGLGSNLLVRDGGIRGAVIVTAKLAKSLERQGGGLVRAGAGLPCNQLAKACARWQLGPAAFFAGIPGTVGGALAMNAGAFGGETWTNVASVVTIDRSGELRERPREEFTVGYRTVRGPAGEWFWSATFEFAADPAASEAGIKEMLAKRGATQPLGVPSCGSVFRNPPGDHAGRLIEAAGLKGARIGGAVVTAKHANFIANDGGATAADIEQLIELVRRTVAERNGVELQLEARVIGEPASSEEGR